MSSLPALEDTTERPHQVFNSRVGRKDAIPLRGFVIDAGIWIICPQDIPTTISEAKKGIANQKRDSSATKEEVHEASQDSTQHQK